MFDQLKMLSICASIRMQGAAAATCMLLAFTGEKVCAQPTQARDSVRIEQSARRALAMMVGDWSFEWRGSNQTVFTGMRNYRLSVDSLRLTWTERFDRPVQSADGVLWYNRSTRRFYYAGAYSPSGEAVLLASEAYKGDSAINFEVVSMVSDTLPVNRGLVRSRISVGSLDQHTWSRFDSAWIVTYRRRVP